MAERVKCANFTEDEVLNVTGLVQIFTNTEAKPKNVDCTWFYQLIEESYEDADLITKKSGNATLCDCEECRSFGIEIYEFFSI